MGIWESGTVNLDTRCFDLLCTGKCDLTTANLKLNVDSADRIPNFFTKNSEGKIVFSNPAPMSIITTPKGHGTWIQIELKTINGVSMDNLSGVAKHICLGIKKRSENDYFDVIHAAKLTSEYVDLFDTDAIELIPLLSKTEVTGDGYELVKTGEEVVSTDFGLAGTSFDFGSVYRVGIEDKGAWIEQRCNLNTIGTAEVINDNCWSNCGSFGIGPINDQKENLVAVKTDGQLAYSSDCISWFDAGNIGNSNHWYTIAYGDGTWSVCGCYQSKKYSIDGGKEWSNVGDGKAGSYVLAFGGDTFMTISYTAVNSDNIGVHYDVYTSKDGKIWEEVGSIPATSANNNCLTLNYGNNKWICVTNREGSVYQSRDGREWENIGQIPRPECWGGCYANGYFYAVSGSSPYVIVRSATGEKWEDVTTLSERCLNVTYYKNKLYSIDRYGTVCHIGIPNS